MKEMKQPKEVMSKVLFAEIKSLESGQEEYHIFDPDDEVGDPSTNLPETKVQLIDLYRPLLQSSEITLRSAFDDHVKKSFWHSSAHILGSAIEQIYDESLLTHGPSTNEGFFYDFQSPNVVREDDYEKLESAIKAIIKAQ